MPKIIRKTLSQFMKHQKAVSFPDHVLLTCGSATYLESQKSFRISHSLVSLAS